MNNRAKLFIPIGFFLVMASLLLFALSRDPNLVPSALLNKPMPAFDQPALFAGQGDDNGRHSQDDLLGNLTILNIWGSWCPPCHAEHPLLMDVSAAEDDLLFVGVSYDYSTEPDREFLEDKGNPFDLSIVDADGSLRIDLGVTGAPETFLIDQNGMIVYRHIGEITYKVWQNNFLPLIEQLRR